MRLHRIVAFGFVVVGLAGCSGGGSGGSSGDDSPALSTRALLGERLFADTNLSRNRTQSCATCHDPEHAFVDPRDNGVGGAVSLGDDGVSLGDRNTPTAAYARHSPAFAIAADGLPRGGQFLDGRAATLADQAAGPPLNPIEMGMPDKASVVARIQESSEYVEAFESLYGDRIFDDADAAYAAMAESIAAFEEERDDLFAPFDSKYDRHLRGEYELTSQESLGKVLFFSEQFTNCNICHQLQTLPFRPKETFSNYEYENIGVPVNASVRAVNGTPDGFVDKGLFGNPAITDPAQNGKFKVPTLRNVAVTGPYMHNGVFADLRTVVLFYDKFNNPERVTNPETGEPWGDPEVAETVALEDLEHGPGLTDDEVDALVAFMRLLTDRRYEHLIPE
ncbi:MAG: methylamine utilization protein MauG [Deltaproteobacteria bacterium]|nr:methylamine utilization protein MauG [Deltaproteobacteria bacterium]